MNTNNALRALLGVLTILFLGLIGFSLRDTSAKEGDQAPQFSIQTDDGRQITPENFGGRVLVLNFWATWCPTCVEEIPSLDQFQKHFAKSGVVVVGVSVDKNAQKYHNFLSRIPVSFETARDPASAISARYGTFQIPETYIIKNGRIMRKFISNQDWTSEDIVQYVQDLL